MDEARKQLVTRRRMLMLLGLGAGASLLAACGGGGGGASPTAAPAKPTEASKPAESKPTDAAKPAGDAAKPGALAPAPGASPAAVAPAAAPTQAAPAAGAATETLRVGASVALTGPVSKEGNEVKNGYDVWVQTVNDKGGIDVGGKRYKIDLKVYDDESKADTGTRLTEKLISEDKVQFILGPFSSGITQATSNISERNQILTVAPQANADGIYERGYKYIFSILPPASTYLKGLIDMSLTLNPKPSRVAIMIRDDPFGIAAGEGAATYAKDKGLEVVFKDKFPANATDVSSILTQVKNATPDIVLASSLFADSVLITKQSKDLQFAPKILGFSTGPSLPDYLTSLGADANFIYGSDWWLPSLTYEGEPIFGGSQQYVELFKKVKNYVPQYHAASGTAAGLMLQLAIQKAGKLDTDAVRQAFIGLEPKTFWGPIGWNDTGKNVKGTSIPSQVQGGKLVAVWPNPGREAEPKYPMPAWNAR